MTLVERKKKAESAVKGREKRLVELESSIRKRDGLVNREEKV